MDIENTTDPFSFVFLTLEISERMGCTLGTLKSIKNRQTLQKESQWRGGVNHMWILKISEDLYIQSRFLSSCNKH
jgi:hypothetical protein